MEISTTALIGGIASLLTLIWTVYQYNDKRKREQDLKDFENYHKLIKELVQPDENNVMWVDRQTAIIYELRNFKRYYAHSYRSIKGLREKWGKVPNQYPRIIDECDRTIKFLKTKIRADEQ